jgi:hypothetical protein
MSDISEPKPRRPCAGSKVHTEEELLRLRMKKNERNRRYYHKNKDVINQKRIEEYDPDKKREYYYTNQEKVLKSQRHHYKLAKDNEKKERLNALLPLVETDEGLKKLIQTHLENLDDIRLAEIATLEKSIILTVNKSE